MGRKRTGFLALCFLLFIGLWNAISPEYWEPPKSGTLNGTKVDIILEHPEVYEEFNITLVSHIRTIDTKSNMTTLTFLGMNGVLSALLPRPLEGYNLGDLVAIRGISFIVSRGYILVEAIQKIKYERTIGFSILGGILFAYYFFRVYTFGSKLTFRRRG